MRDRAVPFILMPKARHGQRLGQVELVEQARVPARIQRYPECFLRSRYEICRFTLYDSSWISFVKS